MKVLAFGDIHGDIIQIRKLAKKAKENKVNLVIVNGDFTHFDNFFKGTFYELLKHKLKVMFVRGNHESEATAKFVSELYNILDLHGKIKVYNNIAFLGVGGANVGPFPFCEDEIYNVLKDNLIKIKSYSGIKKTILVSHVHPSNTIIEKFTSYFNGSKSLEGVIKEFQPDLLICSHVHEASGIEEIIGKTKIINVGKEGKIIEI